MRITTVSFCARSWRENLRMDLRLCMVFLVHLDRDILGDAKAEVESSAKCGLAAIWRRWL